MAIEIVDLPLNIVIFHSYVSLNLPEGTSFSVKQTEMFGNLDDVCQTSKATQ